ncbi:hypothetical protein EON65_03205 [archaeon]|nr:MAG: hypothetical protein EON65_03205 [archaeon]
MTSHSSNNLREGMVSDEEDISLLFCTICFHDLNHHAYNVLEHSELGVALCCICHEKFTALMKEEAEKPRASEDEDTDICHWCYDNDSENSLFICGDGSRCPGQFCAHCLRNNLGEDFLSNVENREEWTCLMCNDQPLKGLRQAFEEGKARSWYAKIDMHKSSSQSSSSAIDESLQQHFIDLLCLLKDEEIKCTEKLSHAALCDQEILVLDELKQDSTTRNRSVLCMR